MRTAPPAKLLAEAEPVTKARLEPARKEEDDAHEAARFHLLQRTGSPEGDLPVERYLEAQERLGRMLQVNLTKRATFGRGGKDRAAQTLYDTGGWTALGPGNVGGRTRSLVIHPGNPEIMWAGAVGGGVWKTTDGGRSWNPLTDLLPSIGITALALDPRNPDILYAGTGEYYSGDVRGNSIRGTGVYRTTNGGESWTRLALPSATGFYYVNKIVVSPHDAQRIYVASWSGVWRSLDGGDTWRLVLQRQSPNNGCQDLVIRTDKQGDVLLAACGMTAAAPTAIFRTLDGAGTAPWNEVFRTANMGRTSLALAPSRQDVIYAMSANLAPGDDQDAMLGIYRSTAGGDPDTWETRVAKGDAVRLNTIQLSNSRNSFNDVCSGTPVVHAHQGEYDNVIAVDPVDPEIVWTGGIDLMRSDDGGRNWGIASFWQVTGPKMAHADHHALVFHPGYDGAGNQILLDANDGGIYRTVNARAKVATGERAACSPYPTEVEWESLNNGYAVTQFYKGAVYPGGGMYFGGTQDNGTQRGADAAGVNNWRRLAGGDGGAVAINPADANIIYYSNQNLALRRSTTGSATSTAIIAGITEPSANFIFIPPMTMDPADPRRLYTGGRTLWRTDNGGDRWNAASAAVPTANGQITAIAVSPSDAAKAVFGTSSGWVYRTTDARTATNATAWTGVRIRAGYLSWLAFDPADANIVYATFSQFKAAGSDQHVYKSTDGGATWNGIDATGDDSIPDVPVFTILPDPRERDVLYLGTELGLFVSTNGGTSWARDQNPFVNSPVTALQLERGAGPSRLFAFTMGRGVWRATLPGSAAPCEYKVTGVEEPLRAMPTQTREVRIETGPDCVWSVAPEADVDRARFLTVTTPASGKGPGSFTVSATPNYAPERNAALLVQGATVPLPQRGVVRISGNDERADAARVDVPYAVVLDNRALTAAATDPVPSCTRAAGGRTAWFRFDAPRSGTFEFGFRMASAANGGDAGAVITMHAATGDALGAEVACRTQPASSTVITLTINRLAVVEGRTYWFQVATLDGSPGGELIFYGQYLE